MHEHGIFDLTAQVAYWMVLSIFPLFIFILTLIGYLPLHGLDRTLMSEVERAMPPDAAVLLQGILNEVVGKQHGRLLLVALAGGLWSAAGGVNALMSALNRAYRVTETRPFWQLKLEAILITLAGSVLAIVATVALSVGPALVSTIAAWLDIGERLPAVWRILHFPLAVFAMLTMVATSYKILPNRTHQHLHFFSPGTLIAVALWLLATLGLRIYVSHFHGYARTYGAIGAVIVLMTWIYLTGLMVIFGGEVDAVLARLRHRHRS